MNLPFLLACSVLHACQSMSVFSVSGYPFSTHVPSNCKPATTSSDEQKKKQSVLMLEGNPLLWTCCGAL